MQKIMGQKSFTKTEISNLKDKYPEVENSQCSCVKNKANCGCITDTFISQSRLKVFRALKDAGTDPEKLKKRLKMLPHHARNEHEWEGGQCDFHRLTVCSCNKCPSNESIQCEGKKYNSTFVFHSLAYGIECNSRSEQAESVIDPDLGRGHTNQVESANSTLARFRSKHWNIHRMHYHVSTNLGLLEANLSFMNDTNGVAYHWFPQLLENMNLPIFRWSKVFLKTKSGKEDGKKGKLRSIESKNTEQSINM